MRAVKSPMIWCNKSISESTLFVWNGPVISEQDDSGSKLFTILSDKKPYYFRDHLKAPDPSRKWLALLHQQVITFEPSDKIHSTNDIRCMLLPMHNTDRYLVGN